jgi:hypothetical protein
VPPNGLRNAQIASERNGADTVWLNYAKVHGEWRPWAQPYASPDGTVVSGTPPPPNGHAYGWHKHHRH